MSEKHVKTRIINRHDTEATWNSSTAIPYKGELIIYDIDETYDYERFKIGDGTNQASDLPFVTDGSHHTHNYAGSASAGGAASSVAVTDTTPTTATKYYPLYASGKSGSQTARANADLYYYDSGTWSSLNVGDSNKGILTLHDGGKMVDVLTNGLSENRTITLPDVSGTVITSNNLPTVKQLTNDAGYLTEHQSLTDYAKKTDLPTIYDWAKAESKPAYLPSEVGADAAGSAATAVADLKNELKEISVWNSLAEAENYAKNDPRAYVGQTLKVIDSDDNEVYLYIIKDSNGGLRKITDELDLATRVSQYRKINGISLISDINLTASDIGGMDAYVPKTRKINGKALNDDITITADDIGTIQAQSVETINGKPLKFFVGEHSEYDNLSDTQKENLYAIVTDDTTHEDIIGAIDALRAQLAAVTHPYKPSVSKNNTTLILSGVGTNGFRIKAYNINTPETFFERSITADSSGSTEINLTQIIPTFNASKTYIIEVRACAWGRLASPATVYTYTPSNTNPTTGTIASGSYVFKDYPDEPSQDLAQNLDCSFGSDSGYTKIAFEDSCMWAYYDSNSRLCMYDFTLSWGWTNSSWQKITFTSNQLVSKAFHDWFVANTTKC